MACRAATYQNDRSGWLWRPGGLAARFRPRPDRPVEAGELTAGEAYELMKAENTLYSVCLNCNTGCGIKVKILDGVAVKIDGNPYNPFNLHPHLEMKDAPETAVKVDAGLCPRDRRATRGL